MPQEAIVYPTDFSEPSLVAIHYAASHAQAVGGKLLVVHVAEDTSLMGEGALYSGMGEQGPEESLRAIVPERSDVPVEHHLLRGRPAEEIVRFAEEQGASLIVLGTHGRRGLSRALMGSVAEEVVRLATGPVLVVRPPRK